MAYGLESTHPEYGAKTDDWRQMRDTYAGERAVKQAGRLYLPATTGMLLDGLLTGDENALYAYSAYLLRAIFPDIVSEALGIMAGIMHREEAEIVLPAAMEPLRKNATRRGESLQMLLRRINEQQLLYGRIGLVPDVGETDDLPHIVSYGAEMITNWDNSRLSEMERDNLNFVITTENAYVRGTDKEAIASFDWVKEEEYRLFTLDEEGFYSTAVQAAGENAPGPEVRPLFAGKPLDFVPFTFIGANDLDPTPGQIPTLPLSNAALAVYRGEADYRQTLHVLSQDTLVLIGHEPDEREPDAAVRIGVGARIDIPQGGDAKFIGIESKGLPEQRKAIEDDRKAAAARGGRLLENTGSQAESGDALRIRVSSKTTTLHSVALTGAAGLERTLRDIAIWIGADPEEVKVVPNLDFIEDKATMEDALKLMEAREKGLPMSISSIHEWMRKNDLTSMTKDEELAELVADKELIESIRLTTEPPATDTTSDDDTGSGDDDDDDDQDNDQDTPDDE